MKKLTLSLAAAAGLIILSGCVAVPLTPPGVSVSATIGHDGGGYQHGHRRDRDGDGVRNRDDRRPDNPYRY